MKNFKKLITLLLSTLMMVTIISGCGKKVAPPEEFAKAFLDLVIYTDSSAMISIGMSEDKVNDLKTYYNKEFKDKIKNELKANKFECTDDDINKLYDAQISAQKKITYTIETTASDDKTATVKIKANHINLIGIFNTAGNNTINEIKSMNLTDNKQALDKALQIFIAKFEEGCNNAEPSSDTLEKTFAFKKIKDNKNKELWVPEDAVTCGEDLRSIISQ